MRASHPGRRQVLALLGGAPAFAAAHPAKAQGEPRRGGVLRVSAPTNPSTLDPMTGSAGSDHIYLYTLYDTLVEWEPATLEPRPGLAESWAWPDPTTLVLNLRQGVVFHDGTPLDAEAVKFNLDRARTDPSSNVKPDLASLRAVRVTGPLQVALDLLQPDTALPLILSDRAGMIVSPAAVKERGSRHDRDPVGSGPWRFVSWADNEKVIVTRNERYWKPALPYLDGIEIQVIGEVNTGLRSVITGQNDFVYFLAPQQKPIIDRAKNLVLVSGPTLWCIQIYLNYGRKPLDDVRVRRALNYAIDRIAFNKATANGLAEPAMLNLPASHWAFDQAMADANSYDPDKARHLLAEAGYKDGFDLDIQGTSDQRSIQREEVLIEQFQKAGIRAKFTNGVIPNSTTQFFVEKKHDAYLSSWTGRPDPTQTYQLLFSKDGFYNAGRAGPVPELIGALLDTRKDQAIADRKQAFARLQKLVTENALVVPLQFQFEMDAHTARLHGFRPNLLGKPRFENVWLDT
jgi:peptide/nickel transport system permease protein/peptide/nickel transport system substrate-binding protein